MENERLNFEEWLKTQQIRQDNTGILAQVLLGQDLPSINSKRKPDEHKYWVEIVRRIEGPGYIYAFNLAWAEYVQAKKSADYETD